VVIVIPKFGGCTSTSRTWCAASPARFLAITFEPYARTGGVLQIEDREALLKVVNAVPDAQVMADLNAIVAYAKKLPATRADRIGMTGFCRGGLYTLLFAAQSPDVKAAWPGTARSSREERGNPHAGATGSGRLRSSAPTGSLRGGGPGHPVADVRNGVALKRPARRRVRTLPGCAACLPRGLPAQLPGKPRKDAWARCLAWFNKYLKG